jgi:Protein of unknown function (DUF1360)
VLTTLRAKMARTARGYSSHEHRPLDGYVVAVAAFGGLAASLATAARLTGQRPPERPAVTDVVLISLATHKLSRLLAKDAVTSPLRAPFARYSEPAGAGELNEEVRDQGGSVRHGIGELITCPFCLAVWVATGLTGGLVLAPRLTRLGATVLTATAVSDFLQLAYDAAKRGAEGK